MDKSPRVPRLSAYPDSEHAFHELGSRRFEQLARALHAAEPHIVGTSLYGPDGQDQFGIDHFAHGQSEEGAFLEVGQSKAERTFSRADVQTAADKFIAHWDEHWADKKIRRFILFVGCAVKSRLAHDEVIAQIKRFAAIGVTFELWDSTSIYERLHGAPAAVRTYLGQDWYERIFGKSAGLLGELARDLDSGFNLGALRVQAIVQRLNQSEGAEITELRRRVRRGEAPRVIQELEHALRSEAALALAPAIKAEKLRLLAALTLSADQTARTRQLLDEADALEGDSARLRAILLLETVGPEALLASLGEEVAPELEEVRAVALLRQNRAAEAFQRLEPLLHAPDVRAEALRLAALAQLVIGDRKAAVALAERASLRDPDARACRQALGVCLFHRALSPAMPADLGEWPQPVDQPMVRASDAARADLERAAATFDALAADPALEGHTSATLWHFACLACMPWRHADARARLADLQASGTMPIPMIAWALARALPFDHEAAATRCEVQLAASPHDFETLLIRVGLAHADDDAIQARALLDEHGQALIDAGHKGLLDYWKAVLGPGGSRESEDDLAAAHPWLQLRRAMDLRPRKRRLQAVAEILAVQLRTDGDARIILAATQLLLDGGWHKSAVKAAAFLVDRVGTAEALGMAALAHHRSQRPADVLATLERLDAFPGSRLPVGLERLKAGALAATGALIQARDASLSVARETGQPQDFWQSIHLQLALGATQEALMLYEEHSDLLGDPDPGHVALARAVTHSHPEAARRITRRLAANAPDQFVTATFELANKLRMAAEQRVLVGRIQLLGAAGKGGVELISLDDIVAMISERREIAEGAFEKFANGHAPIYAVTWLRTGLLPATYLEPLLSPPEAGEVRPLVSARYGRRLDDDPWPENRKEVRLLADLSALLTAQGLGLIDTVERSFAPICVAPDTVNALLGLRGDLEVAQPERLDAARRVHQLVLNGRIADQKSLSPVDTFAVLWDCEGGERSSTLSFTRLFDMLGQKLTPEQERAARDALGTSLDGPLFGDRRQQGSVLILSPGMAVELEIAGLLALATSTYRIGLDRAEIAEIAARVSEAERLARQVDALTALVARLNAGIEDGTYEMVPRGKERDADPARRAYLQVVGALRTGGMIGWVDDRFTSSVTQPGFQVATTVEVIDALVRYGRLTVDEARRLRQRLRAARWLFMPQRADEIVHHLRAATKAGAVVENEGLAELRRAIGLSLTHRRRLQWPEPAALEHGIKGEVPFLLDCGHAITQALVAIWGDEGWTTADAAAASDWLLETLEVHLFPLQLLAASDPRSDYLLGVHAAGLLLGVLQIYSGPGSDARQSAFLDWFWRGHLAPMLRVRPEVRTGLIEMMATHLADREGAPAEERIWRAFTGNTVNLMPLPLRAWLLAREDMRRTYRLLSHGLVTVLDEDFAELAFLRAVIGAERSKSKSLTSAAGTKASVRLAGSSDRPHLELKLGDKRLRLDDWVRRVASSDAQVRGGALHDRADVLDMSAAERAALNDELGRATDSIERARLAMAKAAASQQRRYADLEAMAGEMRPFALADLAPDEPGLIVQHLRFETDLEATGRRLIAERGLAVAIGRLGGLPVAPPASLREAVQALGPDEVGKLLDEVGAETVPPWVQLFLADLMLERQPGGELAERLRHLVENSLSPRTARQWELYIALAEFTGAEARTHLGWAELNPGQQLAACWSHASELVAILAPRGVRIDKLIDSLRGHRLASPRTLVEPVSRYAQDVGNPAHMAPDRLRVHVAGPALLRLRDFDDQREWADATLRALLIQQDRQGEPAARLEIARGTLAPDDALASRFGEPLGERIGSIIPGAGRIFREGAADLIRENLRAPEEPEQISSAWHWLRLASADTPLPADLSDEARQKALTADLGLGDADLREARLNLLTITAVASANGWTELAERIDSGYDMLGPRDGDDDAQLLLEIALWRAKLEAEPQARCSSFARAIEKVGQHPLLRNQAEMAARQFARSLSGQHAEPFVDALARLFLSY